ncbi:unnamed protein product [Clonostachys solani]|uniref:Zn(2)-C6 fungal-type domain-containing protein n=1 Tax=Clonostachys solani TaxID=160281 RepID=A0A9N9ZF65_9HYPO|nr:unnamed protein product [Clonostachys solani]
MPGIPKSRGCQICKQRKIKVCDETWPSCEQCKQRRLECPGPTQLVKFINNASHSENPDEPRAEFSVIDPMRTPCSSPSPSLRLRKVYYSKVGDDSAEYGLLLQVGLPRSNPTTLADRISVRLVASMDHGSEGLISVHMSYLPELPRRLGSSACLRDSVDLFCAAWSDSRRHRKRRELMEMPQYGKLLRSLRRALVASQACSVETLAAMTLLERTSKLFDGGRYADLHLKGIREALIRRGLPKLEDPLEIAVTNEIHGLLLRDPTRSGENDFIRTSPWKEAFDQCAEEQSSTSDVRPFLVNDMLLLHKYIRSLAPLYHDFGRIYSDPFSQGMTRLAVSIRQRLQDMKDSTLRMQEDSLEADAGGDKVTKEPYGKNLMMGKKSYFKSVLLAALYQRMLMCHLVPLRMVYEMSVVYGTPDPEIFNEFREVSIGIWNAIPQLRALEAIVAIYTIHPACLGYEDAIKDERHDDYESAWDMDSSLCRFPEDREALNLAIAERSKPTIGRVV